MSSEIASETDLIEKRAPSPLHSAHRRARCDGRRFKSTSYLAVAFQIIVKGSPRLAGEGVTAITLVADRGPPVTFRTRTVTIP